MLLYRQLYASMSTQYDSRILIRLPRQFHVALKSEAAESGVSLNELCVQALESRIVDASASPKIAWPLIDSVLKSSLAPKLEAIILFGSQARGDATPASDTDLLLCVASSVPLTRELYAEWDRLTERHPDALSRDWSPHFCRLPASPEEAGSLWFEAAIDGIVLWDRSLAVSRFLASLRRYLLAGGRTRRTAYGVPYWVVSDAKPQAG